MIDVKRRKYFIVFTNDYSTVLRNWGTAQYKVYRWSTAQYSTKCKAEVQYITLQGVRMEYSSEQYKVFR